MTRQGVVCSAVCHLPMDSPVCRSGVTHISDVLRMDGAFGVVPYSQAAAMAAWICIILAPCQRRLDVISAPSRLATSASSRGQLRHFTTPSQSSSLPSWTGASASFGAREWASSHGSRNSIVRFQALVAVASSYGGLREEGGRLGRAC